MCYNLLGSLSLLAGLRICVAVLDDPGLSIQFEMWKTFMHKELLFFLGVDLKCSHTADFGPSPRVEWKFKDLRGSQTLIYFDNQPTGMDITLLLSSSLLL